MRYVAVVGSPSLIRLIGFCGRKAPWKKKKRCCTLTPPAAWWPLDAARVMAINKSPKPNCGSELRSCVKVEVAVMGSRP